MTVERVARDVGDEIEGLAEDEMGEPKNVLNCRRRRGGEVGEGEEGEKANQRMAGKCAAVVGEDLVAVDGAK